jgi:nicotinate-nucleotide pyrophosphorylase (carboxylating)
VDPALVLDAVIVTRPAITVCGTGLASAVFRALDPDMQCTVCVADGSVVAAGAEVLVLHGRAQAILTAERTALNFMQRLSGIASLTRKFVDLVAPHGTTILDTRKTTPTLRALEKYAVRCGGGENHRMGLYDRVMIKDNHRHLAGVSGGLALGEAVARARARAPGLAIEVEVETLEELALALAAGPEWVLLDNMTPARMTECVRRIAGRCRVEASGGITLGNVAAVAATGVDAISLGALTHSAPAADLSLEIVLPG